MLNNQVDGSDVM